jgi:hypothetical protein
MAGEPRGWVPMKFRHELEISEIYTALEELYADGSITPVTFACECCKEAGPSVKDFVNHTESFKVTEAGKKRVPQAFPSFF